MSRTKICPTCQKELPLLAVRCRHCGFKLSSREDSSEPRGDKRTHPMTPVLGSRQNALPITPEALPGKRKNLQKQTMMGVAPPSDKKPSPAVPKISAPPPLPRTSKAEIPSSGKSGAAETLARPDAPSRTVNEPVMPDDGPDWIPEVDEISQLIMLPGEDSVPVGTPSESSTREGVGLQGVIVEKARRMGGRLQPVASKILLWCRGHVISALQVVVPVMRRRMLPETFLRNLAVKNLPLWFPAFLARMRIAHGVALVLLALVLTLILANGNANPADVDAPVSDLLVQASAEESLKAADKAADDRPSDSNAEPDVKAPPVSVGPPISLPKPDGSCFALGSYPEFPWKKNLQGVLTATGKSGICEIFGMPMERFIGFFKDVPTFAAGDMDGLPHSSILQVFLTRERGSAAPRLELVFYGDQLFRVVLQYELLKGVNFDKDVLEDLLETSAERKTDHLGRKVIHLLDGEVLVEFLEEKSAGNSLRTLVFTSRSIGNALEVEFNRLRAAEKQIRAGDRLFASKKYKEASERYREASTHCPHMGRAHVNLAIAAARLEDFQQVAAQGLQAISVSGNHLVQADANAALAMAAVYDGSREEALSHYQKALQLYPDSRDFKRAVVELSKGSYDTDRVAHTAARMSCLDKNQATARGVLARGNFLDTASFFAALRIAKRDARFKKKQQNYIRTECQ